MTTAVAFRIVVRQRNSLCSLNFTSGFGKPLNVCRLDWDMFSGIHSALRGELEDFLSIVGLNLKVDDWSALDQALTLLYRKGRAILFNLLGAAGSYDFRQFLEKRAPLLLNSEGSERKAPVVEVQSTGEQLHFEVLPLISTGRLPTVHDQKSFISAMSRFLAMQVIVRRTSRHKQSQDRLLHNTAKLPMKFFCDEKLEADAKESEFFASVSDKLAVDGPWPTENVKLAGSFAETLALYLSSPSTDFKGNQRESVDQIHHVSCHCYTDVKSPSDYQLEFNCNSGSTYTASVEELSAAYASIFEQRNDANKATPMVFLNACGSLQGDTRTPFSFPAIFLESHRAIIGTEARIPNRVAAAFAAAFYRALLDGKSAGESLQIARWFLVTEHNNPLGLFYSLRGDPDLKLENQHGVGEQI